MDKLKKRILFSIRESGRLVLIYMSIYFNKYNTIDLRIERFEDGIMAYKSYKVHKKNLKKYLELNKIRKSYGVIDK